MRLDQMRSLVKGTATHEDIINENAGLTAQDEAMIDAVLNEHIGSIVAIEMAANMAEKADVAEAINEAYNSLTGAFVDMGIINESITINTRRPKTNHVILTKDSNLRRLQMLFTLNLARNAKSIDFKRFKLSSKIRKVSKDKMLSHYGQKAMIMAKKAFLRAQQTPGFGQKTTPKK